MKPLGVALIGHRFMGRAHSHALKDLPLFFDLEAPPAMRVLCGRSPDVADVAARFGWERWENDWRKVVADPEVDVVAVGTPGALHRDMAVAAAEAGKHVFCEKPLAATVAQAQDMHAAVEKAGVKGAVNFNYRRAPAIMLAKQLVDEGRLGDILHFKGFYQQDWALGDALPHIWRMDADMVGPGPAEAGSHVVDLARLLVGEITEVAAADVTFVKQRRLPEDAARTAPVTTDDLAVFITRFEGGALGTFEATRCIAGRRNALSLELNGTKGSLRFELERMNELDVYFADDPSHLQGFRNVLVTESVHPYIEAWWPPGHIIGWEHTFLHAYYEFFQAIAHDRPTAPSFYDGLRCQQVIEAAGTAAAERRWVEI
jgi:predicted dehydrogenase